MSIWTDLVSSYRSAKIAAPQLKAVTLAQWILESGRGTSVLATKHKNFGGLKYRARMKDYAEPVDYTGSDGVADVYCKFDSLEAFIAGYWHFIASGPYEGWDAYATDPSGYLRHIVKNGYAGDASYVQKVVALLEEAQKLLGVTAPPSDGDGEISGPAGSEEVVSPTPVADGILGRLAVVVGHNSKAMGAGSVAPLSEYEYKFNSDVAQSMKDEAAHYNLAVEVFFRPAGLPYSKEIAAAYAQVKSWNATCAIELHFNAATAAASGTEMLYRNGYADARSLAAHLQEEVLSQLKLKYRGLKALSPGDRGWASVSAINGTPIVLCEPFFGSNSQDCIVVTTVGKVNLGRSYLRGVRDWLSTS